MKYLESFDLFGGGEYEKMTRGRFIDSQNKMGSVDLSEKQKIKLSKLFQSFFDPKSVRIDWPSVEFREHHFFSAENKYFFTFPYDDDWYFIEVFNPDTSKGEYYKCDGLDGIEKMLSDTFEVNEARLA